MAFSSISAGATIYLDGNYGGVSHQVINGIPTETHAISLKQGGNYEWNNQIKIVIEKTVTVKAQMETRDIPYDGLINI